MIRRRKEWPDRAIPWAIAVIILVCLFGCTIEPPPVEPQPGGVRELSRHRTAQGTFTVVSVDGVRCITFDGGNYDGGISCDWPQERLPLCSTDASCEALEWETER